MNDVLAVIKVIALCLALGALVSFIFYNLKKRDLFGGFIGGFVVGIIGAVVGGFVLDTLFNEIVKKVLLFLAEGIGFNVIAGFIGAYAALFIMNKLNHDKERTKY